MNSRSIRVLLLLLLSLTDEAPHSDAQGQGHDAAGY